MVNRIKLDLILFIDAYEKAEMESQSKQLYQSELDKLKQCGEVTETEIREAQRAAIISKAVV